MYSFGISIHSLIWRGSRFLITKRPASANFGANHWDCPGGALEVGETPEEGLLREISEETGIRVKVQEPLSIYSKIVEEKHKQIIYLTFSCEYLAGEVILSNEHVEYRWVEWHEAIQLDLVDYLKRALTELDTSNKCTSLSYQV